MATFDATGLTIDTLNEIIALLEAGYKDIYGVDINLESNSPDGQLINIYAQANRDLQEVIQQVNAGFDIQQAIGLVLDQRVSLLSITRQGATFTQQQVEITTDRALTLSGLDAEANNPDGVGYTVADDAGTQFILLDTFNALSAGTYLLTFRAKDLGSITTLPNTITNPITVVIGVIGINNPSGVLELGVDGESDSALKVRATRSTANKSKGFIDGLTGLLLDVEGVTDAVAYENFTSVIDSNGVPAHGIWVICEGGANTDIANVIYATKNAGCDQRGNIIVDFTTVNGSIFEAKFDRPTSKNLWIRFDIKPTINGQAFNLSGIQDYIVENLIFNIGDSADTATVTCIAQDGINTTGGGGKALGVEISNDGISYVDFLDVDSVDEKWIVDVARIDITLI